MEFVQRGGRGQTQIQTFLVFILVVFCFWWPPLHIIEVSNILFTVVVPFNYLLGYWSHPLKAFPKKLFDNLFQIFLNLQNFPQSWIGKIVPFPMSVVIQFKPIQFKSRALTKRLCKCGFKVFCMCINKWALLLYPQVS